MATLDIEKAITPTTTVKTIHVASEQPPRRQSLRSVAYDQYQHLRFVVFTTYRQLWLIVVGANIAAIAVLLVNSYHDSSTPSLAACANAAVANLLIATLVRADYIKNIMFIVCWSVPHSAPLWFRRRLALVYENGGVHSGTGAGALLWFALFTGALWSEFTKHDFSSTAVLVLDICLAVLLLVIMLAAVSQVRRRHHNYFENLHRIAGWSAVALFWAALVLFAQDEAQNLGAGASIGHSLISLPAFWMLLVITGHLIYPWLMLRRVAVVRAEHLTDHAIRLFFDPKERIPPLFGTAISTAPLKEWHAFANVAPLDEDDAGMASCIISNAGDWTAKTVKSPAPYYYKRGFHATGFGGMARIFRTVVLVATGSGIGPCLALLGHAPNTRIRVIWSAPSPRKVFGDRIYDAVLRHDPHTLVWDTRKDGRRPDMVGLAETMYRDINAEAVFFVSNRNLTRKVIYELRKRGVAAFAPVFDS